METTHDLARLASTVQQYEQQGVKLSADWYEFQSSNPDDMEKLKSLYERSLSALQELSRALDAELQQNADLANRDQLQYAYNMVQELIQSRTASETMLSDVIQLSENEPKEYYRALALKEKAAAEQAAKLQDILSSISPTPRLS